MMGAHGFAAGLVLCLGLAGCQAEEEAPRPLDTREQKTAVADPEVPVASGNTPAAADVAAIAALSAGFDPLRDPEADLATARVEAQRGGKRILLDVGGEWCSWCHVLDRFVADHADIRRFRDAHYVWVKVNYSEDNENAAFLAKFPPITGYPHLFVLDAEGRLLHSQSTAGLEKGQGYDHDKFMAFLRDWSAPAATATP